MATGTPSSPAMASASSALSVTRPRGTGTPYRERISFAWYSCTFMVVALRWRSDIVVGRALRRDNLAPDSDGRLVDGHEEAVDPLPDRRRRWSVQAPP